MTRFAGRRILRARCCGATFAERNYSSMNYSGAEFWTDGRIFAPLVPNDDGVRRCVCGCYFLIRNADQIAALPRDSIISPPEAAQRVPDADTGALLASGIADEDMLIVLRRRHWRQLNNPYRVVYRQHRETDQSTFPTYEPTEAQRDNMTALLGLLATEGAVDWLEVSELHRELDQPQEAQSALNRAGGLEKDRVAIWQKMIDEGFTGPMRYRL
jgi:hypothetical protein